MHKKASGERYHRQVILPRFGESGQQQLLAAKVLVIGAGGLGCPVLQYLAAAGTGTIGIVDGDVVALSNLHRQVLYGMQDIGRPKAERAAAALQQLNPDIRLHPLQLVLDNRNALELLEGYDVVVDATDNFPARYLINDACVLLGKPLVFGAVSQFEGQVAVFNQPLPSGERSANYRDLFPVPPAAGEVASCAEGGVLGILPGIIGSIQAGEVIKLVTGIGQSLANRLHTYSWLTHEWFDWEITPLSQMHGPQDKAAFRTWTYEEACTLENFSEISADRFNSLLGREGVTVIDVRETGEQPPLQAVPHLQRPLSMLKEDKAAIEGDILIAVCQSGKRSRQAAQWLAGTYPSKKIYSLQQGIAGWLHHQKEKQ